MKSLPISPECRLFNILIKEKRFYLSFVLEAKSKYPFTALLRTFRKNILFSGILPEFADGLGSESITWTVIPLHSSLRNPLSLRSKVYGIPLA